MTAMNGELATWPAIPYDGVLDRTIFPSAIIPLLKYGTVDNTVDYN